MFKKSRSNFNLLAKNSYSGLIVSSLALVLLALAIFWTPYLNSDEAAATDEASVPSAQAATPTVSIGLQDRIDLDITPTATGATSSASATLTVSTTESAGYSIYLSATDNNLRSTNPANTSVIAPAETGGVGTTIDNLATNTWGYALTDSVPNTDTLYQGIPTDIPASITTKDTSTIGFANDTYSFTLGAKVDSGLTSGVYQGSILVSIVADPRIIFNGITYMQEMTSEICQNAFELDSAQLIDTRDGKNYWVTKLKDGNCWMTQNLALDITEAGLSVTDTDITEDWNSSSAYPPEATLQEISQDVFGSSYGFGKYLEQNFGGALGAGSTSIADAGFLDVSGSEWQDTFVANGEDLFSWMTADTDSHTYDAHYLIGNYYSYNVATAGTGYGLTAGNASGSICPKNWHLPSADEQRALVTSLGENVYIYQSVSLPVALTQSGLMFDDRDMWMWNGVVSLFEPNSRGEFWSAAAQGASVLRLSTSGLSVGDPSMSSFDYGEELVSVRCLAAGN